MSTAEDPRPRRTQQQRRARTRRKLLDATIESIAEVGYSNSTVRRISELAGVSSGGRCHLFPHRIDLVVAAIADAAEQRLAAFQAGVEALPAEEPARLRQVLDLVWADFNSRQFMVGLKVWVAAADDPALYEQLLPVSRTLDKGLAKIFTSALSEHSAAVDNIALRTSLILNAIRGIVFARSFEPRPLPADPPWPAIRAELEQMLFHSPQAVPWHTRHPDHQD